MEKLSANLKTAATQLVSTNPQNAEVMAPIVESTAYDANWPPHIKQFVALMQSKFPPGSNPATLDVHDVRGYGRNVANLTGDQCRAVFALLQDRHIFRPSVAEVHAAVMEVAPPEVVPAHALRSYRSVESLRASVEADLTRLALPSVSMHPGGGRQLARERIAALREQTRKAGQQI